MVHLGALSKPRATELSKSKGFQLRPLKIPINTNWPSCVCQGIQLHEYEVNPVFPLFFLPCHLTVAPAAISQQHGAAAEPAGSRGWLGPLGSQLPALPAHLGHSTQLWGSGSQHHNSLQRCGGKQNNASKLNKSMTLFHKDGKKQQQQKKPKPNRLLITNNIEKHKQNKSFWFSEALHEYTFLVTWKELTAFSTSANAALRFFNRRKEAAARWEACEGTHLLASTGRCLVNRRQKEGQSKQRKQPAVSHFPIKICLARNETHIKLVFCTFRVSENQNQKANEHQKASLQNWDTVKSGERCHLTCQVLCLYSASLGALW